MKTTKKSLLAKLACSKVKATMIGGLALDEWQQTVANIKAEDSGARESDTAIHFDATGGQQRFILKPKFTRERVGTMSVGSTRYVFHWGTSQSEGEIKDLRITADGMALELTMVNDARMIYTTVEV